MSTGFSLPTAITKRIKTLNAGAVTNDVVYVCPANCITDVYLSHGFNANLSSLNLVRVGGTYQNVKQLAGSQNFATGSPVVLGNLGAVKETANANSNAIVGEETANTVASNTDGNSTKFGSVIRLFPNDFLVANYTGGVGGGELVYSTVETFGQ